jgi:multicomponent Na+:H+ antiporter subunit A
MILAAVVSIFILALTAPVLHRWLPHRSGWVLSILPLALTVFFAFKIPQINAGLVVTEYYEWVPRLGATLSIYLDGLSLVFALLICGVGTLIVIYSGGYLSGHPHLGRFYTFLLFFMASMLGVVLAGNLISLFVFWELTSISSYFLIGFDHQRESARTAALQALRQPGNKRSADTRRYDPGPRPVSSDFDIGIFGGLHQIGPGAVSLLAAVGHGRTRTGQCLSTFGHHG